MLSENYIVTRPLLFAILNMDINYYFGIVVIILTVRPDFVSR